MRPKCDNWPNVRSIWDTLIKGALHKVHETVKIQKLWIHVVIDGERELEVSLEAAARFTLRRHHLVERTPVERMLEVVDDVMGLNAQGARADGCLIQKVEPCQVRRRSPNSPSGT